jgi:hypothetical protein
MPINETLTLRRGSSLGFARLRGPCMRPFPSSGAGQGPDDLPRGRDHLQQQHLWRGDGCHRQHGVRGVAQDRFNASLTDQTFFSASYRPTPRLFRQPAREKTLYSQALDARLAHAFSQTSVLDLTDAYSYNQNPEALLNGAARSTPTRRSRATNSTAGSRSPRPRSSGWS